MDEVDKIIQRRRELRSRFMDTKKRLDEAVRALAAVEEATAWVAALVESIQTEAHTRLSLVVTKCLAVVFGPEAYTFHLEFGGKGKVAYWFERDGERYYDMDQVGGGVLDVAAFALRVAAVCAARPKPTQVLVLDEPFRFVSKEYRSAVAGLLTAVAEEFGVQIVMVTHAPELVCGSVVSLKSCKEPE